MCARVGVVHVAVHTCVYVETWTHQREGSRRLQKLCRPGKRHCLISSFFKLARRGEKNKPLFIPPCLPVCPFTSVSSVGLYTSLIFFFRKPFLPLFTSSLSLLILLFFFSFFSVPGRDPAVWFDSPFVCALEMASPKPLCQQHRAPLFFFFFFFFPPFSLSVSILYKAGRKTIEA